MVVWRFVATLEQLAQSLQSSQFPTLLGPPEMLAQVLYVFAMRTPLICKILVPSRDSKNDHILDPSVSQRLSADNPEISSLTVL